MDQTLTPRTLVVVPARGGSVGVPLKNLRSVGGSPLVARAVGAALDAPSVDLVVVSTDHQQVAAAAQQAGARVVERPASISGGTASSESAVLHALDALAAEGIEPEVTVLLQATSPFIDGKDLDRAIVRVLAGEADVVLAAAPTHDFMWTVDAVGRQAVAVGHDAAHRPRRQDREQHYRETGAFYVMRTAGLREVGHRFFGRVALEVVDPAAAIEIDTPSDLALARLLAASSPALARAAARTLDVDAVVTDFDGVHTDDHATVSSQGLEGVRVHRGDGLGMAMLRRAGVPALILSTETDPVVRARAIKLGVDYRQGVQDKATALTEWLAERGIDPARTAYVGNDVNDLPALDLVGWPVAVADARPEVLAAARLVLERRGGDGAVRELADLVLAGRRPSPVTLTR